MVSHPNHYQHDVFCRECIDVTKHIDFCRGNAIKYLWRFNKKNGREDVAKAQKNLSFILSSPDIVHGRIPRSIISDMTQHAVDYAHSEKPDSNMIQAMNSILVLADIDDSDDEMTITMAVKVAYNATQKILDSYDE